MILKILVLFQIANKYVCIWPRYSIINIFWFLFSLSESKAAVEEAVLEALDNKYNRSDISSTFLSKDREFGAVALTSEAFYRDLLNLGEFDISGSQVGVEARPIKVFAGCNNAG